MTRTLNRLKTQVWWLNMHTDVYDYIHQCEVCARNTPPNKRYLHKSLDNPLPFESISLDFVGPRLYKNQQYWYAVIIDHCTRYIVAKTIAHPPTHADVIRILHLQWVMLFGAPANITLDNAKIFNAAVKAYLQEELGSKVIFTSPGYPQGNAINETSHKVIEKSIAIKVQTTTDLHFEDIVAEAVYSYNLAPNVNIGDSPFRRLFGMESAMPCYQGLSNLQLTDTTRRMLQLEGRIKQAIVWNLQHQKELVMQPCNKIKVGDTVVYHRTDYQQRQEQKHSGYAQYTPAWSLPNIVVQVQDGSILCKEMNKRNAKPRQVPIRVCRLLTSLKQGIQSEVPSVTLDKGPHTSTSSTTAAAQDPLLPGGSTDTPARSDRGRNDTKLDLLDPAKE